jgi:hypothetical protein
VGTAVRRPPALSELTREVEAIGRAVDEDGPISADELAGVVGARRWVPAASAAL